MKIQMYQVDAFTNIPFGGNPAAVCPLSEGWLEDLMLQEYLNGKQGPLVLENGLPITEERGFKDNVIPANHQEVCFYFLEKAIESIKMKHNLTAYKRIDCYLFYTDRSQYESKDGLSDFLQKKIQEEPNLIPDLLIKLLSENKDSNPSPQLKSIDQVIKVNLIPEISIETLARLTPEKRSALLDIASDNLMLSSVDRWIKSQQKELQNYDLLYLSLQSGVPSMDRACRLLFPYYFGDKARVIGKTETQELIENTYETWFQFLLIKRHIGRCLQPDELDFYSAASIIQKLDKPAKQLFLGNKQAYLNFRLLNGIAGLLHEGKKIQDTTVINELSRLQAAQTLSFDVNEQIFEDKKILSVLNRLQWYYVREMWAYYTILLFTIRDIIDEAVIRKYFKLNIAQKGDVFINGVYISKAEFLLLIPEKAQNHYKNHEPYLSFPTVQKKQIDDVIRDKYTPLIEDNLYMSNIRRMRNLIIHEGKLINQDGSLMTTKYKDTVDQIKQLDADYVEKSCSELGILEGERVFWPAEIAQYLSDYFIRYLPEELSAFKELEKQPLVS